MLHHPDDIDHVLNTGPTPPYIVVMNRENFTRKNILTFKENRDRVSGVILIGRNIYGPEIRTYTHAPDDVCPNRHYGLYVNDSRYAECRQNAWQEELPLSGLLYDDIPFPIFVIFSKESIQEIVACFDEHNIKKPPGDRREQDDYPLCGVHLDSFMTAAGNSEMCINSRLFVDEFLRSDGRRCTPIGMDSIFAYYRPAIANATYDPEARSYIPEVVEPKTIVMLVTKLSSVSMFTAISPGADSTLTGIVTLLSVAEALGRIRNNTEVVQSNRNIVFALFDSEPFGYLGSTKFIQDITSNRFPSYPRSSMRPDSNETLQNLNLTSIDLLINLDQLASYPNHDTIYLHSDPDNKEHEKLTSIVDIMKDMSSKENVKFKHLDEEPKLPLPPTSAQQFIKSSLMENSSSRLMGLVVSNYEKHYTNKYYHGPFDDWNNMDQITREKQVEHLTRVANFIAKSLYKITYKIEPNVSVSKNVTGQLLDCYLQKPDCPLITATSFAGQSLHRGQKIKTFRDPTKRKVIQVVTNNLLAYFLGEAINFNKTECQTENRNSLTYEYKYINGKPEPINDTVSGMCIQSQVIFGHDDNPAIYYDKNQEKFIVNRSLPTWTWSHEIIRNPARLYLIPSPSYEWCVFALGLVITIASFIFIYKIKRTILELKTPETTQQDITA